MKLAWPQMLAALGVGVVLGAAGVWWSRPLMFHRRWGDHQMQTRLLQRFSSKLHLTPDQRTRVAAILEAKRQKIDALRAEMRPQFEAIRTSTIAEIRPLLTPAQQQTFDAMNAAFEAKAKRFRERFRQPTPGM